MEEGIGRRGRENGWEVQDRVKGGEEANASTYIRRLN